MRSYEAARGTFNKLETIAHVISLVGTLLAIGGGLAGIALLSNAMPGLLAMIVCAFPGLMIAMYGSSCLASAQMGRASVDCAEYAQLSLSVSRQQLELAQEALNFSKYQSQSSYAARLAKAAVDAALDTSDPVATADVPDGPTYADRTPPKDDETAPSTVPSEPETEVISSEEGDQELALPNEVPVAEVLPEPDAQEHSGLEVISAPETQELDAPSHLPDEAVESESLPSVEGIDDLSVEGIVIDAHALEDTHVAVSPVPEMQADISDPNVEEAPEAVAEAQPKKEIIETDGVFSYGTMTFSSLAAAERYVSQFGVNTDAKLSDAVNGSSFGVNVGAEAFTTDLVYRDGHFVVGGKAFKTKGLALEYQRELQAKGSVS